MACVFRRSKLVKDTMAWQDILATLYTHAAVCRARILTSHKSELSNLCTNFFFIEYLLSCKYEIGVFDRLLIEQNIWPLSIDASDDTAFGKGANAPSCNHGN